MNNNSKNNSSNNDDNSSDSSSIASTRPLPDLIKYPVGCTRDATVIKVS